MGPHPDSTSTETGRPATRPGLGASSWSWIRTITGDVVVDILVLAGIFDGISGNPVHAILLFAVAAALARDAIRSRSRQLHGAIPGEGGSGSAGSVGADGRRDAPARRATTGGRTAAILLAATFALAVGSLGRYSWPATTAILVPAAIGLAIAWRGPQGHRDPGKLDAVGTFAWVAVFLTLALWELTNLLLQPSLTTDSYAHPTISVMSDPALASHLGRSVAVFGWLLFGWFLIER